MKRVLILATILFLSLYTGSIAQILPVGTMTLNKGGVKLRRAKVDTFYRVSGEKIPIHNLDEIQTGKDSSITIELNAKDDKLELYSQSAFKIDQVTAEGSQLSMSIGKARFKIKKGIRPLKSRKKRRDRFRVRTANAIVGVKGTEFVMSTGAEVTNILTIEGVVNVASVTVPDIDVDVGENQVSQIKQSLTPTQPVTVPPSVQQNILNTDSPSAFNNVTFGTTISATNAKPETKKKRSGSGEKPSDQKSKTTPGQGSRTGMQSGTQPGASGTAGAPGTATTGAAALLPPNSEEEGEARSSAATAQAITDETGGAETFADGSGSNDLGTGEVINLETIETEELDAVEFEEPDIDPDDVLDLDTLIEDIEEDTSDLQEEIEAIQEEILENQLHEIKIKINHQ